MSAVDVTAAGLANLVADGEVVLADFWATWCGPCRAMAPVLDKVAVEYAGRVKVVKVDVDAESQAAVEHRVSSVPTLILFVGGQPVWRHSGAMGQRALTEAIDDHLPN